MTRLILVFVRLILRIRSYKDFRELAKKLRGFTINRIRASIERKKQNRYDVSKIRIAQKVILFLVPGNCKMAGGIMSIFYFYSFTKEILPNALALICTFPGYLTYAKNDTFQNNEQIYRFEQVINNCNNTRELVIHIPEYYAGKFYQNLTRKDMDTLKSIDDLHINILNQNIEIMPSADEFSKLLTLTGNITQATGFKRYTTQKVCEQFSLPLYYVPSFMNLDKCVKKDFEDKEKLILYSPDNHHMKSRILETIQDNLTGFRLREIADLSFEQFLYEIAKSLFCITFGEGFDGYFIQPYYAKSIGICVYNDTFFPSSELTDFPFVYESYDQLNKNVIGDIHRVYNNKDEYEKISKNTLEYLRKNINKKEETIAGLIKLYDNKPTFVPKEGRLAISPGLDR